MLEESYVAVQVPHHDVAEAELVEVQFQQVKTDSTDLANVSLNGTAEVIKRTIICFQFCFALLFSYVAFCA